MGAGLNPSCEVRRDAPLRPNRSEDSNGYVTIHLDNFSHAELKHWNDLAGSPKLSADAERLRAAWDYWHIPSQPDKAVMQEVELVSLGCAIAGDLGVLHPPRPFLASLISLIS